jgi:membrane-associated protein
MEILNTIVDFVLHLDMHLVEITQQYGLLTYAILFGVVFAETGLIVTPFLPGDSLLFATGAIAALGSLNIWVITMLLFVAAVLGDAVNYWVGNIFGQKIVDNPKIKFINQEHIDKTQQFYKKHGGKTIILARFIPLVRTFAPFVAGVGKMKYKRFFAYNVVGGFVWVFGFTLLGYFFGNLKFIKENFHYAIFAIVFLSIIPVVYEYIQHKRNPDVPSVSPSELKKAIKK